MTAHPTPRPEPSDDGLTRVGIRDLRHNLSDFVKRAQNGERIVITDRGKQVARLVPEPARVLGPMEQAILDGRVIPPSWWPDGERPPRMEPAPAVAPGEKTISEVLQELREDVV